MEILICQRGAENPIYLILSSDLNCFYINHLSLFRLLFRCSLHRKLNCPARGTLSLHDGKARQTKAHNHSSSAYDSSVNRLKSVIKKAAEDDAGTSLRAKFNDLTRNDPNGAKVSFKQMANVMYRRNRVNYPKVPNSPDEYVELLQGNPNLGLNLLGSVSNEGNIESVLFSTKKTHGNPC